MTPFILPTMEALTNLLKENAEALNLEPDAIRRSYSPNVELANLNVGETLTLVFFTDSEKDADEEGLAVGAFWKLTADVIHVARVEGVEPEQVDPTIELHERLAALFEGFEALTLADGRTVRVKSVRTGEALDQEALENAELALGSFQLEIQIFNPY